MVSMSATAHEREEELTHAVTITTRLSLQWSSSLGRSTLSLSLDLLARSRATSSADLRSTSTALVLKIDCLDHVLHLSVMLLQSTRGAAGDGDLIKLDGVSTISHELLDHLEEQGILVHVSVWHSSGVGLVKDLRSPDLSRCP